MDILICRSLANHTQTFLMQTTPIWSPRTSFNPSQKHYIYLEIRYEEPENLPK